jgi:hypothetical protein
LVTYHWVVSLIVEDYRGAASAVEIIDVVQQKKVLVSDLAASCDRFDLFHKIRVAQILQVLVGLQQLRREFFVRGFPVGFLDTADEGHLSWNVF